ncbi:MAG: hypothetical protein OCU22_01215 [Canidatus Methanoxibalbensis ujae]|nr:hypothetical protein [Candidatus Methanoxibalbensis ujae]
MLRETQQSSAGNAMAKREGRNKRVVTAFVRLGHPCPNGIMASEIEK